MVRNQLIVIDGNCFLQRIDKKMNNEIDLIKKAQIGDELAYNEVIKEYIPKIKSIIKSSYKLTPNDADDVCQLSIIKAWDKINSFRFESSFYTWLYVLIKNESLHFIKTRNKVSSHEIKYFQISDDSEESEILDSILIKSIDDKLKENASSILERIEHLKEYKKIIEYTLEKLHPKHSQIIRMIYEEKNYKQISEELKIPIGTVMSRIHFAKINAQKIVKTYVERNKLQYIKF